MGEDVSLALASGMGVGDSGMLLNKGSHLRNGIYTGVHGRGT